MHISRSLTAAIVSAGVNEGQQSFQKWSKNRVKRITKNVNYELAIIKGKEAIVGVFIH
jgi:hypothetical protein